MIRRLFLLAIVSALLLVSVQGVSSVNAQTVVLTQAQENLVRKNCQNVKNTLNQLHASDALLRVNRGQVYEALSTKLMDPFNARLGNNRLDNRATSTISINYRSALDAFRAQYRLYEKDLSEAIKTDCQADPRGFHTTLERARAERLELNQSVRRLHRIIDDYRSAVDDFMLNYQKGNE